MEELLTSDVFQIYQWNILLRGQLSQVSEILQTLWRPGQEKPFIFVQILYSEGQRGSQRLSQEWAHMTYKISQNKDTHYQQKHNSVPPRMFLYIAHKGI